MTESATPRSLAHGRRRPSGEAPPLPRPVTRSTGAFLALGATTLGLWVLLNTDPVLGPVTAADGFVLGALERSRTGGLTTVAEVVAGLGSIWAVRLVGWVTLLVLLATRRFQHLIALLVLLLAVTALNGAVAESLGRMRPTGVDIITPWEGYAHPSLPVAGFGLAVVGALYTLVPAGRWRSRLAILAGVAVAALGLARMYLGADHPTDVFAALVTGVALPVAAFRILTPDDVVPVSYRRGRAAHLDIGGARRQAIVDAFAGQLGLPVIEVEPFALTGSAGSTPLRIRVHPADGGAEAVLFAKLYATTHLRADRWYKLGRTVLYGRLEDERPFNAVRQLVQYEDHMIRLFRDAGVPTAAPVGLVEITPEREYLLVTEFLEGAVEIDSTDVDTEVIDDALGAVGRLWDAGLAHRDIKPSNVLVRDGCVHLVDPAFAEVRPTPWRQAVDLANMMLTLGLYADPAHVYERALRRFTPDEVAEAFAASRGVTIPSQLRGLLRAHDRDLRAEFCELAPARPPIAIQRWSVRRVGLTAAIALAAAAGAVLVVVNLRLTGLL